VAEEFAREDPFVLNGVVGIQWWRDWIARLYPHRWWILFSMCVFVFSLAVYLAHYT
jgi:hypothetical protein